MKKKILLLMGVFFIGVVLHAQVGINTQKALGIFHVDAKGNTSGTVTSPVNDSDDVIVSNDGYLGIGLVNPKVKLDVKNPSIGAFRIVDGDQALGKGLVSDANGYAEYTSVSGSWYGVLWGSWASQTTMSGGDRVIKGYSWGLVANPLFGSANGANGIITVPYAGKYRISIAGEWECSLSTRAFAVEAGYTQNGTTKWVGITGGGDSQNTLMPLSPTFIIIDTFAAGDQIALFNRETSIYRANSIKKCYFIIEYIQ